MGYFAFHTQSVYFPWVYLTYFSFLYPASSIFLGIFGLFLFPIPSGFLFLGYIRPVFLPYTQSLSFPWVYWACFHSLPPLFLSSQGLFRFFSSLRPASFTSRGLFRFFSPLRPAPFTSPGLISLLFLPTPRPLDLPGAYFSSFPLYAPLPSLPRGLFDFFSSLRPAPFTSPGLIRLLWLFTPRSLHFLGAYLTFFPLCAPLPSLPRGLFRFF